MKKFFHLFSILIYIVLFLFLAASWVFFVQYQKYQPASYQSADYQEINAVLDNPFRGFYQMQGYMLSEEDPSSVTTLAAQAASYGSELKLAEINLLYYADSDLSDNALQQLDNILSEYEAAGCQVMVRFLYDWDGNGKETEPESIDQIFRHMEQVGAVVNQHRESVFLIQGAFNGSFGEMNATHYGTFEDVRALITKLSEVIDPSIYLSVRTPSQLRGVTETRTPISEDTAFDGSLASRLGLFNDGLLGSLYDLGTYDDTPNVSTTDPEDKGTREEELAFQEYLCQFVPNGGEAVIDNPYNDLNSAIADLSQMHITYIHNNYDQAVLDKWKYTIYHGDDCYDGMSGYDYINAHLGYRYVVCDSSLTYDVLDNTSAELSLTIQNTGFAPAYRIFDGTISLQNTDTGLQLLIPSALDNRIIKSGSQTTFTIPIDIRNLTEGTYEMSFSLTDPYTNRNILFANADTDEEDRVHLGTLTIDPVSPEGLLSYLLSH